MTLCQRGKEEEMSSEREAGVGSEVTYKVKERSVDFILSVMRSYQ
jgi:hypothetical protein